MFLSMSGEVHGCPRDEGARRVAGEFVVVMADPVTGEIDAFGPFAAAIAEREVARRRAELAAEGLAEVLVVAIALSSPH